MSSKSQETAIRVSHLSKCYQIYDKPHDRLKQFVAPRIQRLLGQQSKQYFREFWALKDVSFEVKKGQTVGVIGRNGAGKSTLLQLICGTLYPSSGKIEVHGRVAALLELGSGFNPEFTGKENIYFYAGVLGLSQQQTADRFAAIEAFAEVESFINQPVKTYSSGMALRLAFAVIAHVDADILIVDEALAVGDVFFQQKCMRFLKEFQEKNGTILFVSHDTSAVTSLCSRAIFLTKTVKENIITGSATDVCKIYLNDLYAERAEKGVHVKDKTDTKRISDVSTKRYIAESQTENIFLASVFQSDADSFGVGGATIQDVWFENEYDEPIKEIVGGYAVFLCIKASMKQAIKYPAFGFMLKDRLGQYIFAEGTDISFRVHNLVFEAGDEAQVRFKFRMPILIKGEYTLSVAIAEGIGDSHIQHHWLHDAIVLQSLQSRLVHGIAGVQDIEITIDTFSPHTGVNA